MVKRKHKSFKFEFDALMIFCNMVLLLNLEVTYAIEGYGK